MLETLDDATTADILDNDVRSRTAADCVQLAGLLVLYASGARARRRLTPWFRRA
jgi:hypothetical protein